MSPIIYLLIFAYLALVTLGQRIAIGAPAEWATVKPGSNITVEVDRPVRPPRLAVHAQTHQSILITSRR